MGNSVEGRNAHTFTREVRRLATHQANFKFIGLLFLLSNPGRWCILFDEHSLVA